MKTAFYLFTAWMFSYRLFWQAVATRNTQPVVEKAQVGNTLYRFMVTAYVAQGVLLSIVLGLLLTGPEEISVGGRVLAGLFEKGLFVVALNLLFKMPLRTLALVSILVSDFLSAVLILLDAPLLAHLAIGVLLGFSLLRYMVKKP